MKVVLPLLVALVLTAGCAAPRDERPEPSAEAPGTTPSATPRATSGATSGATPAQPSVTRSATTYPEPRPASPRVGESFTAAILASGGWVEARVTVTAVDSPAYDARLLLFRWKATNIDDHALAAPVDPISYRFAGLDDRDRRTRTLGYEPGSSARGCRILPGRVRWKPGQTIHGCSAQELPAGSRLARVAFLSGDPRNPQTVEFFLD